jgi:hypothetical protein
MFLTDIENDESHQMVIMSIPIELLFELPQGAFVKDHLTLALDLGESDSRGFVFDEEKGDLYVNFQGTVIIRKSLLDMEQSPVDTVLDHQGLNSTISCFEVISLGPQASIVVASLSSDD